MNFLFYFVFLSFHFFLYFVVFISILNYVLLLLIRYTFSFLILMFVSTSFSCLQYLLSTIAECASTHLDREGGGGGKAIDGRPRSQKHSTNLVVPFKHA